MYKIYKITNLLNNKVYIGQTKNSLSKRFREHCSTKSFCLKLRNAVSLCCRGYSETCGGYHWQYIESEVA